MHASGRYMFPTLKKKKQVKDIDKKKHLFKKIFKKF